MSELEAKGPDDAPQKPGQKGTDRWKHMERGMSVLTVIGVLAYTVITWRTYVASQANAREQHRAMIAALNRADTANKIARDTARRELRAYLTIPKIDVHVVKGNLVQTLLVIENAGRTPAFDFSGWTCLYVGAIRLMNGLANTPTTLPAAGPAQASSAPTIIGPGSAKDLRNMSFCGHSGAPTAQLTSSELTRLKDGVAAIYLYGRWTYRDAFGADRYIAYHVINNDFMGLTTNGSTIDMKDGFQGN